MVQQHRIESKTMYESDPEWIEAQIICCCGYPVYGGGYSETEAATAAELQFDEHVRVAARHEELNDSLVIQLSQRVQPYITEDALSWAS